MPKQQQSLISLFNTRGAIAEGIAKNVALIDPHNEAAISRADKVNKDFTTLRQFAKEWDKGDQVESFWEAMTLDVDPVLPYCICRHAGFANSSELFREDATNDYLAERRPYNAVLGELIPDDLRDLAVSLLVEAFEAGTNPTVAEDWSAFLSLRNDKHLVEGIAVEPPAVSAALNGLRGLTFLAGGTGCGKTSLAVQMTLSALRADEDLGVIYYSFDMSKTRTMMRIFSHAASLGIPVVSNKVTPTDEELAQMNAASSELRAGVLRRMRLISRSEVSRTGEGFSFEVVARHWEALAEHAGVSKFLIVIDGYRNMPLPAEAPDDIDGYRCEELKGLAGPSCVVLVTAEVRKGEHDRRELTLDDLMGSSSQVYAADNVLLLSEDRQSSPADAITPMILRVAKGRDGATRQDVRLQFHYLIHRFTDGGATASSGNVVAQDKTTSGKKQRDPLGGRKRTWPKARAK